MAIARNVQEQRTLLLRFKQRPELVLDALVAWYRDVGLRVFYATDLDLFVDLLAQVSRSLSRSQHHSLETLNAKIYLREDQTPSFPPLRVESRAR